MAEEKGDKLPGLSVNELFSVLAPGAMIILSFGIWVPRERWAQLLASQGHEQSLFITSAFILLAYGVGLVLNAWAVQGWLSYVNTLESMPLLTFAGKALSLIVLVPLTLLFGWRYVFKDMEDTEIKLRMYLFMHDKCGETVSLDLRLFDFFHFCRTFCWDSLQASRARMLLEADLLYRRRLFCHGVGLALTISSLEVCVRLGYRMRSEHFAWGTYDNVLLALLVAATLGSIAFRAVNFRLSRDEATYTYALFNELVEAEDVADSSPAV